MKNTNLKNKAESIINQTIEDAGKFLLDYFKFLESKNRTNEIDNLIVDFSVSLKNSTFKCESCKRESNGNKFICSHCFKHYCQKCFDVNKLMKKHPYTFYADSGCEDLQEIMRKQGKIPDINDPFSMNKNYNPGFNYMNSNLKGSNFREIQELNLNNERNANEDPDKKRIEKMIENLNNVYHIKEQYSKEDIINAIKIENFDEIRILNRLFSMDKAHL